MRLAGQKHIVGRKSGHMREALRHEAGVVDDAAVLEAGETFLLVGGADLKRRQLLLTLRSRGCSSVRPSMA